MSNELANFADLKDRVSKTIRERFGELIPDEMFKDMCDKAIKDYFESKELFTIDQVKIRRNYNDDIEYHLKIERTAFEHLLFSELHKTVKSKLVDHIENQVNLLQNAVEASIEKSSAAINGNLADNIALLATLVSERQIQYQIMAATDMVASTVISKIKNTY